MHKLQWRYYLHMMLFLMNFSSVLAYTSQPYSEVMDIRTSVTFKPCAKSSK